MKHFLFSAIIILFCLNSSIAQVSVWDLNRFAIEVANNGGNISSGLNENFFKKFRYGVTYKNVYTVDNIDEKIDKLNNINASIEENLKQLNNKFETSLRALDTSLNKTIIENIDNVKFNIKQETIQDLEILIREITREEIDNLKKEMQIQIDELKKKVE